MHVLIQKRMPCISVNSYLKNLVKIVWESWTSCVYTDIIFSRSRDYSLHYHVHNAEVASRPYCVLAYCISYMTTQSHDVCWYWQKRTRTCHAQQWPTPSKYWEWIAGCNASVGCNSSWYFPLSISLLIQLVVHRCAGLSGWRTGYNQLIGFSANTFASIYTAHLALLAHIWDENPRAYHRLKAKLYQEVT